MHCAGKRVPSGTQYSQSILIDVTSPGRRLERGLHVACVSGGASRRTSARNRTHPYPKAFFFLKVCKCVGGPHRQINRQLDTGRERRREKSYL